MDFNARLSCILQDDQYRMTAFEAVREMALPDSWIAAGFVRDAVWDHLHGRPVAKPWGDIDILWFDPGRADKDCDREIESRLRQRWPNFRWSVKNQARMHLRNADQPYVSATDAMRYWPETATAVAVRLPLDGPLVINAPFGLDDLFAPRLAATPGFSGARRHIFDERIVRKKWLSRYPLLTMDAMPGGA